MLSAGEVFDNRYKIDCILGVGGMGEVYKATQVELQRTVALKILRSGTLSEEAGARMEREALALSTLRHKSIVSVYSFGVCEGMPYLAMEYVEGKTLESMLADDAHLSLERTLWVMQELCAALGYAHRQGIVHRDLKPENIVLDEVHGIEEVKILDLGLARIMPESGLAVQKLTETGTTVGSVHYMSPEQCMGQKIDGRSDIYSLGVIMYRCLTGRLPFGSDNRFEAMMLHLGSPPPPLAENAPAENAVPGLQSIIYKALAKRADDRYQSVDEMREDLRLMAVGDGQKITSFLKLEELVQPVIVVESGTSRRPKWQDVRWKPVLLGVTIALVGFSVMWVNSPRELYLESVRLSQSDLIEDRYKAISLMQRAIKANGDGHDISRADANITMYKTIDECLGHFLESNDPRAEPLLRMALEADPKKIEHQSSYKWAGSLVKQVKDERSWKQVFHCLCSESNPAAEERSLAMLMCFPTYKAPLWLLQEYEKALSAQASRAPGKCSRLQLWLALRYIELGRIEPAKALLDAAYSDPDDSILPELSRRFLDIGQWSMALDCARLAKTRDQHIVEVDGVRTKFPRSRSVDAIIDAVEIIALEHLERHKEAMVVVRRWQNSVRDYPEIDMIYSLESVMNSEAELPKVHRAEIQQEIFKMAKWKSSMCKEIADGLIELPVLPDGWRYLDAEDDRYSRTVDLEHSTGALIRVSQSYNGWISGASAETFRGTVGKVPFWGSVTFNSSPMANVRKNLHFWTKPGRGQISIQGFTYTRRASKQLNPLEDFLVSIKGFKT